MNAEATIVSFFIVHRSPLSVSRLAVFLSILLDALRTQLLLRLLMCPSERSGRVGNVSLPESQDQMRVL